MEKSVPFKLGGHFTDFYSKDGPKDVRWICGFQFYIAAHHLRSLERNGFSSFHTDRKNVYNATPKKAVRALVVVTTLLWKLASFLLTWLMKHIWGLNFNHYVNQKKYELNFFWHHSQFSWGKWGIILLIWSSTVKNFSYHFHTSFGAFESFHCKIKSFFQSSIAEY